MMPANSSPSSHIPMGLKLYVSCFLEQNVNQAMLFNETLIELLDNDIMVLKGYHGLQFKLSCNEEKGHFFNLNTVSGITQYKVCGWMVNNKA